MDMVLSPWKPVVPEEVDRDFEGIANAAKSFSYLLKTSNTNKVRKSGKNLSQEE